MAARLAVIAALLCCVAGCASSHQARASGFDEGTSVHTLSVGGLDRTYLLHKPAGLPASAPLVVMLHGGFGNAAQAEKTYGWDQLADSAKFAVAYPDGLNRAWNVDGGGCCGRSAREGVDDVAFVTAVIGDISHNLGIDPARVYAAGISNGGIMSYTLACNTSLFAAIGPDSATQLSACRSPHPASVMHIHGTADRLIRYDGGRGAGFAHIDGLPVPEVNAFWRNVDHCAAPASSTAGRVTESTAACAEGRSVVLITVEGGGHEWPSFATQRLWEFFAAHPR